MKAFDPVSRIKEFNELKNSLQRFTAAQIREGWRKAGIPSNYHFWKAFESSGLIEPAGDGHYVFRSSRPVHYTRLQAIYGDYRNKLNRVPQAEIRRAVKLLKENGYMVLKQL